MKRLLIILLLLLTTGRVYSQSNFTQSVTMTVSVEVISGHSVEAETKDMVLLDTITDISYGKIYIPKNEDTPYLINIPTGLELTSGVELITDSWFVDHDTHTIIDFRTRGCESVKEGVHSGTQIVEICYF